MERDAYLLLETFDDNSSQGGNDGMWTGMGGSALLTDLEGWTGVKQYAGGMKAVIHCYSYSPEMAREYVKMGYYIGVGGVVTFKNARRLKDTVKEIPLESIVLETDCPYLAPEPFRGKRNSSLNLPYIAKEIAEIKEISCEKVVQQTEINARKLYNLEKGD